MASPYSYYSDHSPSPPTAESPATPYNPYSSERIHRTHPRGSTRLAIAHPYARLYAKKEEVKRRKIWNHALEKSLFSPYEISTIGAPQRRTIYIASLEAHIDQLHAQLLNVGFWPVPLNELTPYHGLNSKTAKSIVSGLQNDVSVTRLKMLELERANKSLSISLNLEPPRAVGTLPELISCSPSGPTPPEHSPVATQPSMYAAHGPETTNNYSLSAS